MSETQRPKRTKRTKRAGDSDLRVAASKPRARNERAETAPARDEPVTFSPEALAEVERFAATQPFPLDAYQIEAARHLAEGRSVLVAAPTGTGKTLVAEMGIWQARRANKRAIYTAPLKALSNQKFRDLRTRYGAAEVGLLTGDIVENAGAPIVVMTTEIYRNMLLEGLRAAQMVAEDEAEALVGPVRDRAEAGRGHGNRGDEEEGEADGAESSVVAADDVVELARRAALDEELSTVGCVIFDELHFLSDPERGPVWEEAIIHSPAHVKLIGLSATVSNADELRQWIERVHGPVALVFHNERAVPLEHYFYLDGTLRLAMDAEGRRVERFPNIGGEAKLARMRNRARRYDFGGDAEEPPRTVDVMRRNAMPAREVAGEGRADGGEERTAEERPKERLAPEAGEILTVLRKAGLLPCIYFLPGRRAVETAAESAKGHLLVSPEDRERLHDEVREWIGRLPAEDQKLEQVRRLGALLPRGLAFHHAGLLPGLKVMVETLFQRGELRAVFATDTLALGINMPARSVVLGSLSKFDGTQMRLLTPNEYQQLTGRAGRRGMDAKGAAILPYSPWDAFEPSFAALTASLQPVTSAFSVRYNTVLNLWTPGDQRRLRLALAASFREFQRRGARFGVRAPAQSRAAYGQAETFGRAARKAKQARARDEERMLSAAAAAELTGTTTVLRWLSYIGQDDELTVKGVLLRAMFHPAGMLLTELLISGAFDELSAGELAEVVSWFTFDDDRNLRNFDVLSQRLTQVRREVYAAQRRVLEAEYDQGLTLSPGIVDGFHGVALNWSRGFTLGGLLRRIDLAEGDLLVTLNQTIDLMQQVQGAVRQALDSRELWRGTTAETRRARYLADVRGRLERIHPILGTAWRGMLRGSVAQSRAIPSIGTPANEDAGGDLPPVPMAEDAEPDEARSDRVDD